MSTLRKEIKQSRSFDSAEQEAYLNLQRTAGAIAGQFDQMFRSQKLSQPLYNVLRILRGQQGKGLPSSRIGERMVTREPDVTRLVDKLVSMNLAARDRSATDRRVVLISITPAGLEVLGRLETPIDELHRRTLGHLSASELESLNRLLVKARQSKQ
jgi:DNA-binding MarR family transcriptional regulator